MISRLSPEFREALGKLDPVTRRKARQAYQLFKNNPRHGSLNFKRLRGTGNHYSARIDDNYRVLGVVQGNAIIWYWVGPHDEYDRMIP